MVIRFDRIQRLFDRVRQLDEREAWLFAVDEDVRDEIIRLNTQEQLFDQGIDSKERGLGDYSEVSVQIFGKPRGHIRLFDTGAYYESHQVIVDANGLRIVVDDVSIYDEPLTDIYGPDIVGLTQEHLNSLHDWLIDNYIRYVRNKLLQ